MIKGQGQCIKSRSWSFLFKMLKCILVKLDPSITFILIGIESCVIALFLYKFDSRNSFMILLSRLKVKVNV